MNKLVSVIIPIYNVIDYMDKCIESIINQTYSNIQIILVDDGSTDGSSEKCDLYQKKDSRVTVIHKKNGGLSSARNAGIDISKGSHILFVDGDDYLDTYTIEYLLNLYLDSKIEPDLIQFKYREVRKNEIVNNQININKFNYKICTDKQEMFINLYKIGGEAASACTKLYRKEVFNNLRFKDGILHEDEYLITDVLSKINSIVYTDIMLYNYVTRDGSIMNSSFYPKKMDVFLALDHRLRILKNLNFQNALEYEYARYFLTLINMYCNAKKSGYLKESNSIKIKLKFLLNEKNFHCTGKLKLLEYLCRIRVNNINLYYVYRKHFGRI